MRFIKLQILNLASLDRQGGEEINFEEGALKDSTIFSIVGPTGSGKSTILDAICLALYNRAPRYPRMKGQRNQFIEIYGTADDGEKNRPAPTDSRNILTRGKKDAYSKLTFLANNRSLYRAEWSIHRKTKNIDEPITALYKLSVVDGQPHEEEVEWDTLPDIIGLDYDQFLRTVLIAQGSFANFLKSNENERYELLEKLVGCEELYTNIADKIKREKEAATDAYNKLAADFSAYDKYVIKDTEQLDALIDHIKVLEDEDRKVKEQLTKISEDLRWYAAEKQYIDDITRYTTEYNAAIQRLEAIKTNVDRLSLHDTTLHAVAFYKEIKTAEQNIKAKDTQLQLLSQQQTNKQNALKDEVQALQELKLKAQNTEQALHDMKPHIDRARGIKGELAIAQRTVAEKTRAGADAKKLLDMAVKAVKDNKQAVEKAQSETNAAGNELAKLKDNVASTTAQLQAKVNETTQLYNSENDKAEAIDAVSLQNAKSRAEKKQTDIKDAIRIRTALTKNAESQRKNTETAKTLTDRNNVIDEELSRLTIEALASELETHRKTYTLMTCENWQEHRASLEDEKPCPLCGSVHHPYADKSAFIPVANDLKKIIDNKQQELSRQTEQKEKLNAEKSTNQGQLNTLEEAVPTLQKEQQQLLSEWAEIHQAYPEWQEDVQALRDLLPTIDNDATSAQTALNNYNTLVKKIGTLRKAMDKAVKAFNDYKQQSDTAMKLAEKSLTDAQKHLETEQGKTANLVQQKDEKSTNHDNAKQRLADAKADVEAKKVAITNEIGNKDPDAFEQELQAAKKKADLDVTKKNDAIADIRADIQGLQGQYNKVSEAKADEQQKKDDNTHRLSQWLTAYNDSPDHALSLTAEDIASLYTATDDWEAIRTMQQRYTTDKTTKETTLNNARKSHEDHQLKKPELSDEELLARKAELEGRSNDELINEKARKQRHDDAKQQMGTLGDQKDAAELLKAEWEQINNAIGADGKTLRKIAQCYTLRFLVEHANVEIRKFNSRYELQQVKNSLGIRVIDHDRADDVRDVTSLSGGETFIVSLGLALGLSALSSRSISFENLFIDEGFGTLDPETLDSVIDSLSMLQTSQGKKVGVISHTDTMTERIATQIRIIKNGHSGSSHIEIYPK